MLNEEKVKVMTKLAMYEQGEGKRYLPISKYYRTDYLGLALIKNFFLVTIGYGLVLAGVAAYFSEYLMENIHKMNLIRLGIYVVIGYAIILGVYTVITYIRYSLKYYHAKKSIKTYYMDLARLGKIYSREEKKPAGRGAGGYKS